MSRISITDCGEFMTKSKSKKRSGLLIPKTIMRQLKATQKRFEVLLGDGELPPALRKYVDVMQKQLEKYAGSDLNKLKNFLESERKVFEKFRKKIKKYIKNPKKETNKLIFKARRKNSEPSNKKARIAATRSAVKSKRTAPRKGPQKEPRTSQVEARQ